MRALKKVQTYETRKIQSNSMSIAKKMTNQKGEVDRQFSRRLKVYAIYTGICLCIYICMYIWMNICGADHLPVDDVVGDADVVAVVVA